jgi:hypothetical protein
MKLNQLVAAMTVAGGLAFAGGAEASIVYDVNQSIGAGGVVGTITTDGHTGVLSASDFTAWNLTLTGNGGATRNLVNGPSGVAVGNISAPFNPNAGTPDLTADTTHIFFNFDATDGGYFVFQTFPFFTGAQYWCNASLNNNFDCAQGKSVVPILFSDPSSINQPASGNQIIATAASVPAPEPSSLFLILSGFAGLAAFRRSRRYLV